MKKLFTLFAFIACLICNNLLGQAGLVRILNFDSDDSVNPKAVLTIDTLNYHHNIWQIGAPHKVILDSPYSAPNVIMTDTLNTYPPNDTSVFTLKIPALLFGRMAGLEALSFKYRLDIDSGAKALVEFSFDSGLHWINIIDSLPFYYALWHGPKPRFDTSTISWQTFDLWIGPFSYAYDTTLVRFTFISDSMNSGKDGWMIDDFGLGYWVESVPFLQNPNLITLYPNPSRGNIYIHTEKSHKDATITIHDMQGRQVYNGAALANGYLNLQLPNGVYTLKYSDEEEYCVKQIVIQN